MNRMPGLAGSAGILAGEPVLRMTETCRLGCQRSQPGSWTADGVDALLTPGDRPGIQATMHMTMPNPRRLARLIVAALICATGAMGEPPLPEVTRLKTSPVLLGLGANPMPNPPRNDAESTLGQMYVPPGFKVELIAGEPELRQPVAFAFDERGRIWVAEAYSYPQRRAPGQGLDRIVIFEDRDGDGKYETRRIFVEGLNLVSGLEVGYGGIWVGAAPELLFIPDRNHDDVPDGPPEVLLDGFGYQDTHECLNSFLWGPDGWLYGNQGVFNLAHIGKPGAAPNARVELRAGIWRYHPVRREFEIFAEGGSNQWGLDYDERGQIFMAHCRSFWGKGGITHVIKGGHYWNQANANYAPFIIAMPPADFPELRNYMLASARHDHGAGGAGIRGTDAIYGGHSHVGTMIYLGDNWPDEYRGQLFTHNLGGHQINREINQRLGSGFETIHAPSDIFFCTDPKYVAVDLQYGPDGAVYMIDWYDQQHCHNPNTERWDRGNGRLYRMQYQPSFRPVKVDLASMDDTGLVRLQSHKNEWYARMSRKLLHERSASRPIDRKAQDALVDTSVNGADGPKRLRAIWALHCIGALNEPRLEAMLSDKDEFVRAWAIQLITENSRSTPALLKKWVERARNDASAVVRLYAASAIPHLPEAVAWELIGALAQHGEDAADRNLPLLLWQGLAQTMEGASSASKQNRSPVGSANFRSNSLARAFTIAEKTSIPMLAEFIYWYAAARDGEGLNKVVAQLASLSGEKLPRRLAAVGLGLEGRTGVNRPPAWTSAAPVLYAHPDLRVQRQAELIAAALGDSSRFPHLRETLADTREDLGRRRHAFAVLSRASDEGSLTIFLGLLDDSRFTMPAINLLARFANAGTAEALLSRLARFSPEEKAAALNALIGRAAFAGQLLDAVKAGRVPRDQLTAYHIRQLTELHRPEIDRRVLETWGKILPSPAEKEAQIVRLQKVFEEAPLWAYESSAGKGHFQKLCGQCHLPGASGLRLGPDLTGSGRNGIRYFLENIIDPNAVIGTDFQMTTVETRQGDVISGLVGGESASALTMLTTTEKRVIPKGDIAKRSASESSLMPEGLLDALGERERIELLKYLITN